VVITNTNYETKKLGNKRSTQQLIIGFFGNREHGILIETKVKLFLKKVSFKMTMQEEKSLIVKFLGLMYII